MQSEIFGKVDYQDFDLHCAHICLLNIHPFSPSPTYNKIFTFRKQRTRQSRLIGCAFVVQQRSMLHCISKYYLKVNTSHKCTDCISLLLYDLFWTWRPICCLLYKDYAVIKARLGTYHPQPATSLPHFSYPKNRKWTRML